jgi:hypothetical protein
MFPQEERKDMPRVKTPKPVSAEGKSKSNDVAKCFCCSEIGHHQMDCSNDPVCYQTYNPNLKPKSNPKISSGENSDPKPNIRISKTQRIIQNLVRLL